MGSRSIWSFAIVLAVFLASALASPALASGAHHNQPSFAPRCHAATSLETSIDEMAAAPLAGGRWTCSDENWVAHKPVAWLYFDRDAWNGEERPRYFFTRISRYKSITFAALDADGTLRKLEWKEADAQPFAAGPVFELALPEIKAETHALLVRIERPHSIPLLTEARLTFNSKDADWSQIEVLLLAFVLGMLVLPLFFDISFYIVLRERFVLLHAALVMSMMGYVLFGSGLVSAFSTLPMAVIAIAGPLFWSFGAGLSLLFVARFLEEGAQSPMMHRLTVFFGYWCFVVPGSFGWQMHGTQAVDDRLFFYAYVPVLAVFSAAIAEAVYRGSKSARFIAVAWTPLILASIERLLRGVGVYTGPSSLDQLIFAATGLEVMVISLAIAERFLMIRRERDAAVTEARMLEQLSERDALTGLYNRRGLKDRFDELAATNFGTFVLIDLDRFKSVNDRYGHQIGDAALIACAQALRGNHDPDLVAARLGGEEFVVLLRGEQTLQRAEALRKAITMRIASEVEGLDAPVTASAGVIEIPRNSSFAMSFDTLYARADALMYEAKASGRNRMLYERMTVFDAAPAPRPASSARERPAA